MQVVTSEQGCVGIIALTGRIDATTASSFETSCRELLDSGAKKVVVDLGGVEYISSAVRLDNVPYFCFKVQDWGAPFDPFLEAPVPDVSLGVDERPVGGLGIHLIKSVVAHYTYAYYEQSNIIELYFALPE